MSRVYERPFEVAIVSLEAAPVTKEQTNPVGRHLDGCRIGFDAGGGLFGRGCMVSEDKQGSSISL